MRHVLIICLVLCCFPSAPAEELLSDISSRIADDGQLLALCDHKDDITARTALGILIERGQAKIDEKLLSAAIKLSQRPNGFEKVASLIAISAKRKEWTELLYSTRTGKGLAAAVQAASAVMTMVSNEKSDRIPGLPGGGGAGKKKKKKNNNKAGAAFSGGIDNDIVLRMLKDKSSMVQEFALIAAAYFPSKAFDAAVNELDEKKGAISGLKLLYDVKAGSGVNAELVERAFGRLSKQAKPIRGPNVDMMYQVLHLPAIAPACEALGLSGKDTHVALIHEEAFEHTDVRVQIEAAKAMGRIGSATSVPVLIERIEGRKNKSWPVMIAVLDAIGMIPDTTSFQPLIDYLEDEEGRLRLNIVYALNSIRGEKSHLQNSKQWQTWWDENKETFKVDVEKTKAFRAAYMPIDMHVPVNGEFYGLPIYSDRLCFVVDTSNSMKGDKIANLREQTEWAIDSLTPPVHFNLVDFGGKIKIYYSGGLCQDKKGCVEYVKAMPMSYATRSLDSMEAGMEIDPVDTIYFLSDGAPIQTQLQNWSNIHTSIDYTNRYRPVAMFTVSFSAGKSNAVQMETLARRNAGRSKEIE